MKQYIRLTILCRKKGNTFTASLPILQLDLKIGNKR